MASELQIKRAAHEENVRHNKILESIESGKLSETIANNLRNYDINVSKNEIESLKNDQLNEREIAKLTETIRSNLAKELETNRHNLNSEQQENIKRSIEKLSIATQPGAIIAALIGILDPNDVQNLYGSSNVSALSNWFNTNYLPYLLGKKPTTESFPSNKTVTPDPEVIKSDSVSGGGTGGGTRGDSRSNNQGRYKWKETQVKEKDKDEDEIPTDFSNSHGPSKSVTESNSITTESSSSKPHNNTGNIIYSGGANVDRTNSGPGMFI